MTDPRAPQTRLSTERHVVLWLAILVVLGFLCYLLRGAL